uniref:glycogen debranching protein n=1 Tax=Arcanobacterium phocae TaxID=131112 RepID=UPI003450B648
TESSQQAGGQAVVNEVKDMVAALHAAGIEVLLDVVYNHSCEGGIDGVTVSWRGLGSTHYYRHDSANPGALKDTTGCGNSFDFRRTSVIRMTLDSLRYWVEVIGVDGFRFDLAVTLGREGDNFNQNHPLYSAMATDPVLSTVKLINEPWDVGYGGWRTGQFPVPTADWNDRFRDTLRSFWLSEPAAIVHGGHGSDLRDLATRMAGSADLFGHGRLPGGRGVHTSVNFVTAHDGFSLNDLTAYSHKHNDANLEDNRDGSDNNLSWNHGVEGSASEAIMTMRRKSARNLMACLILAAGTPMLTAGDEILKTQHGNNNAYCQNSPLSWLDWELGEHEENMLATTSFLLQLRREHAVFRPTQFFTGSPREGDALRDMEWLDASGNQMQDYTWFDPQARLVQMLRSGRGISRDALVIINGQAQAEQVTLPWGRGTDFELMWASQWERPRDHTEHIAPGGHLTLAPFSVAVLLGGTSEK